MRILSERRHVSVVSYIRFFANIDLPSSGFAFDCDEHGNVEFKGEASRESYRKCLDGTYKVEDRGVEKREHDYVEPAFGECNHCLQEVMLSGFTNTCECGRDYNSSGQELAPRCQWGEETGESLGDILRIP